MTKFVTLPLGLLLCCWAYADTYTINASEGLAYQLGKEKVTNAMVAIYAPLLITPEVVFLPSRRGLQLVDNGQFDAEAGRIDGAINGYDNLIKIPYPLSKTRLSIYCVEAKHCVVDENMSAVTIQGGLMAERYCKLKRLNCDQVMNDISAFKAIEKGYAPAIIANDRFALGTLCQSGIRKLYSRALTKVYYVHHYIHKKHAALAPDIAKSIENLIKSNILPNTFQSLSDAAKACDVKLTVLDSASTQ